MTTEEKLQEAYQSLHKCHSELFKMAYQIEKAEEKRLRETKTILISLSVIIVLNVAALLYVLL